MAERLPTTDRGQDGYANAVDEDCNHAWKWIPAGDIYQCSKCAGITLDPAGSGECFITTAVHGHSPTLEALRAYRDGPLSAWAAGRGLISVYERVSPPIAATLHAAPDSSVTRWIRWVVFHCGSLADRHARTDARILKASLSLVLITSYALCLVIGSLYWLLGDNAVRDANEGAG